MTTSVFLAVPCCSLLLIAVLSLLPLFLLFQIYFSELVLLLIAFLIFSVVARFSCFLSYSVLVLLFPCFSLLLCECVFNLLFRLFLRLVCSSRLFFFTLILFFVAWGNVFSVYGFCCFHF